ncbi:MAG: beta strand repeat-containing protein, partial [Flexibacteraceae bacterium]
ARTSGNLVTNGTGSFIRWYGISGLPNAVNSISGLYPFVSTNGLSRLVSLYFNSTTALNTAGSIGFRHSEANGITTTAAFTDGGTNIENRTNSGWVLSTPASPSLVSGQTVSIQVTAEGTCSPPDNTAAQDLRFTTATTANGNHLSVGTSTTSVPVVARTGLSIANLTGTYYVTGSGTTLPNNVFTAKATGNWNSTATWEGNVVPPADAAVIIPSPFVVTLTANASCASLNLANGATLNAGTFQIVLGAGRTTQINGTLNTANNNSKSLFGNAGSTFDVVTNSVPSSSTVVFSPTTSAVNYNGTGAQTIQGVQYRNLTISTANRTGNVTFESGATTSVNGVFTTPVTFGSGFGFVTTGSTFRFNGADIQTYTGSINFDNVILANSNELRFNGTLGVAGVLTFTNNNLQGNNTINFNGTGNQTIPSGNYQRVTIGGGARTVTLSPTGTIMITSTFTPSYDPALTYINTNSTIGYAFGLTVKNFEYFNLRIENSGAMTFDNTGAGPGAIKIAGSFLLPDNTPLVTTGSTVEYNGTGAQTILGGITYHNLIVSGNRGAANMNLGGGLPVTVTGNFNISAATTGIWTVQPVTLSGSTAQTITGVPTFAFANLTVQGAGLKTLGSNITVAALSTLTLNGNIECGAFDFTLGSTLGSVTLANSPTGTIRTSGTGKLIRFFNNSTSIPVTAAPSNGNQHLNFPLATSAGTTRQVYFFSSAAQTPTTAG